MATVQFEEDDEVILVEFALAAGVRSVSLSLKDIPEKSREAVDHAMKTMRRMAKKTIKAIRAIPASEKPDTISVSFGLKLTAEGGAVVAKAGVEAGINVTMTWQNTATTTSKSKRK